MAHGPGGAMGEGGNMDLWGAKLSDVWDILGWILDVLQYQLEVFTSEDSAKPPLCCAVPPMFHHSGTNFFTLSCTNVTECHNQQDARQEETIGTLHVWGEGQN